jgi:hypothetical protein
VIRDGVRPAPGSSDPTRQLEIGGTTGAPIFVGYQLDDERTFARVRFQAGFRSPSWRSGRRRAPAEGRPRATRDRYRPSPFPDKTPRLRANTEEREVPTMRPRGFSLAVSDCAARTALLALAFATVSACGGSTGGPATPEGGSGGSSEPTGGSGGSTPPSTGGTGGTPAPHDAAASGGTGGGDTGGAGGETVDSGTPVASDSGPAAATDASGPATGSDVTAGMTKLFDGTTLTGWEQGTPMLFTVKDGAIDGQGTTGGVLIITKDDYADFRLIVTSRMVANNGKGHLGVCFYGGHAPAGKYNGCKLLIPPSAGSWDYASGGGLPGLTLTPHMTMVPHFDNMQWHTTEIVCHLATGTCRMATDGVDQLTYKEPNPARLKKGPIGLQIHAGTSEVQYKDVYVDPMPADDMLRTVKAP